MPKPLWEQEATWCVHFNGLMNLCCDAGISYDDLKFGQRQPYRRELPCLKERPTDPTRTDLCPNAEYLTEAQAKAKAAETEQHIAADLKKMLDGICLDCDQKIESERQVGRCVYASPCGHRMYQGRARR